VGAIKHYLSNPVGYLLLPQPPSAEASIFLLKPQEAILSDTLVVPTHSEFSILYDTFDEHIHKMKSLSVTNHGAIEHSFESSVL
jgi:hypothetical protein